MKQKFKKKKKSFEKEYGYVTPTEEIKSFMKSFEYYYLGFEIMNLIIIIQYKYKIF